MSSHYSGDDTDDMEIDEGIETEETDTEEEVDTDEELEDSIFFDPVEDLEHEYLLQFALGNNRPRPYYTRDFSGEDLVQDTLYGHPVHSYNYFRMTPPTVHLLNDILIEKAGFKPGRYVGCLQMLCQFLKTVGHNSTNRDMCETIQHSSGTVCMNFRKVLNSVLALRTEYIRLPINANTVHDKIKSSTLFYPYFKNALGAIDRSHISAIVRKEKQNRYRNRKGFTSQNVMGVVSFDHTFLYVSAGWEGSAGDMKVLRDAIDRDANFIVPDGKYYLVDSGYANSEKFLAPYRGNRYHISDYGTGRRRNYRNAKDKFNHRHAQLRNCVEKAWGILKKRFRVLREMPSYPFKIQTKIVIACCGLHNFIARHNNQDRYFMQLEGMIVEEDDAEHVDPQPLVGRDESARGEYLRRMITDQLWNGGRNGD